MTLARFTRFFAAAVAVVCLMGADWPQWRGPARDGKSPDTGLLDKWPATGPRLVMTLRGAGGGFSSMSIVDGKLYTQGYDGDREYVVAFDLGTGQRLWRQELGVAARVGYAGSRSTPTVDGDRLYVIGVDGDVACLERATGRVLWRRHMKRDWGGRPGNWGYAESPLVDGDAVVITPGGRQGTIVKLNKLTGNEIWTCVIEGRDRRGSPAPERAAYASSVISRAGGIKQYVQFLDGGLVGVEAQRGRYLWRYDAPANRTANIATPIVQDPYVFAASAYGTGGGLVRLRRVGTGRVVAEEVYFTRQMQNHHGGMVLHNGLLFGCDRSIWTCLDFRTGEVLWKDRGVGKGSLVYADNKLILYSERGRVGLIAAARDGYRSLGEFDVPGQTEHPTWAHPVVINGQLFLRNWDEIFVYDISKGAQAGDSQRRNSNQRRFVREGSRGRASEPGEGA